MRSSRAIPLLAIVLFAATAASAQDKPAVQNPPPKTAADVRAGHWLASGFVGSNFGDATDKANAAFGASLGYLFRDRVGAEFDAAVSPDFQLANSLFGTGVTPRVNSYMANAVVAMPFEGRVDWRPFVSAGVGALSLRSGLAATSTTNAFQPDDSRLGANVGGGVMAFTGSWGFKADVRYFRATGSYNANPAVYVAPAAIPSTLMPTLTDPSANALASAALSGLHFWRANVGLAIRW